MMQCCRRLLSQTVWRKSLQKEARAKQNEKSRVKQQNGQSVVRGYAVLHLLSAPSQKELDASPAHSPVKFVVLARL
jgi:hypothetical protein